MLRKTLLTTALSVGMMAGTACAFPGITTGSLYGKMTYQMVNTPSDMSLGDAPQAQIIIPSDDPNNANVIADKSGCECPNGSLYADQNDLKHWTFTKPGYDTCGDPTDVPDLVYDFKVDENNGTCATGSFVTEQNSWVPWFTGRFSFCKDTTDQYATLTTVDGEHPSITFKGLSVNHGQRAPHEKIPN